MRWIFRAGGILLTLAILALGSVFLIPGERIATVAARQFEAASGRALTFTGEVRPTLWPLLGATSGPVTLANAGWSDEGPLLQAEGLEIGLDPLALLRGEVALRRIEVLAPRIVLERAADGALNWDFTGSSVTSGPERDAAPAELRGVSLDRARVTDGALTFIDHRAGTRTVIAGLDAEMSLPDFDGPASLTASGMLDGDPFAVEGRLGRLGPALRGEVVEVALHAAAAGSSVAFEGRAGLQPAAMEGSFDLALRDLPALFALLGQPAPDLPPDVAEGVSASGRVTLAPEGSLHLRGAALEVAGLALAESDIDLTFPRGEGPASLVLSGTLGGAPVEIDARLEDFATAMSGGSAALRLSARAGQNRLSFEGRAGNAPVNAEGRVDLALGDLPGLFRIVALAPPDLPEPLRAPASLAGQVSLTPESINLRDAVISAAGNRLTGSIGLTTTGPRPTVTGQLAAGILDLSAFMGSGDADAGTGTGGAVGAGWPTDPIDASIVGMADADLSLAADEVNLGTLRLGPARIGLSVDRARAVFDLREVRMFDGNVTGEFVVNNRSGLSLGGALRASDIALLPLLRHFADYERLSGTGSGDLSFLVVGNTVDALMRSASGMGRITLGQGEIIGFDLAGMLRNLDLGYVGDRNRTIYESITGSFSITDGVLANDNLRLQSPRLTVDGRGQVDLGSQRLDYRLVPAALTDGSGAGGLRVPLRITGPWSDPTFRLDGEALADELLRQEREELEARARDEARRLEDRARAEIEEAARERLGVERQPGESAEDAVRRAVEGEIERGLLRLFGQ